VIRRGLLLVAVAIFVIAGYFAVTFVQVWSAARSDHVRPSQAIVVMGAAQYDGRPSPVLTARLNHAFDLYHAGVAPIVVVTGGRQPGDRFTEASAGFTYLRAKGVPERDLRIENQGTNSWESLAAAADFLRRDGITEVVIVTSPYHSLRVEKIAGEVHLKGHASPVRTSAGVGSLVHLGREAVAVGVGRVIGYRRLVDLDYRVSRTRGR
jgi:uncharacterized SAM-binding protein YcdF (DUF218 family)